MAREAKKLSVIFAPGEDSPGKIELDLSARCRNQIQLTLQQVTESISTKPGDVARLQKAQIDLAGARLMAVQFGLDPAPIEQQAAWVQQAALGAVPGAVASLPSPVAQADYQNPSNPVADAKHKEGLDKLERARLELRNGCCAVARKLAEDAFANASYGVEKEAELVLHTIDAEEHNQRLLAAQRTFDAGVDAYTHGEFKRAAAILGSVELALLPPQQQQRLREIMSTRKLQVTPIAQADNKVILTKGSQDRTPGTAVASDQADDPLASAKAMEQVQFQQMYARNTQATKSAMELFRLGQKMKAVELLTDQLSQIEVLSLSNEANNRLRAPLEKRLSEFRTMMAQDLLAEQKNSKALAWDEGKYQHDIQKRQGEVADLIKQCSALNKEGKYKEGLALAYKAKELDPDNVAATAYIMMTNILINQQHGDQVKDEVEDYFLKQLTFGPGPTPTDGNPFSMTKEALKRLEARKNSPSSWMEPRKNPKERAIEYRLEQPIQFGFRDTPLREVIATLSALSNVPIFAEDLALQEANIALEHPLTMDANGMSMKSALNILLGKMRLTYVIKDESLMITTVEKAHNKFRRAVYSVADLIVPVEDHPVPDVFNLQKVLEKHLASQYAMQNYVGASPLTTQPMGLPLAPPVSAYGSGLGTAWGTSSQSQAQSGPTPTPAQMRRPGATMEDLLIDLIKGTIAPQSWKDMGGPGTIQYYPLGMALVINQAQEVQEDVENLLKALRRLQDMEIAIEMRVVLVAESFYERIGMDFDVNLRTPINPGAENQLINSSFTPFGTVNRNLNFNGILTGLTPAGTLTPDLNIPITNSSYNFSVPPFGGYTAPGVDGGLSLGIAFLSEIQVFMILEAAQADSRTNIMMAPKITVFNGQTAFINVTVQQFINLGITAFPINGQILFQPNNIPVPFGTVLTVTPVVSADRRFVRLNLIPNISNNGGGNGGLINGNQIPAFPVQIPLPNIVDGPIGLGIQTGQPVIFNTFFQQPTISTITMNTTVNVPDGGTVLLGGMKVMTEGRNEAGPPILSKIPYLDRLFRNVGWGRDAQSLMIMVTPRIIINEEEEGIYTGAIAPIPRP